MMRRRKGAKRYKPNHSRPTPKLGIPAKRVKTIEDKLTNRHVAAINAAKQGVYGLLTGVCLECCRAINTCYKAEQMGVVSWSTPTIAYYQELLAYLEQFITDEHVKRLYFHLKSEALGD